jgi:hypothetical protein
MDGSLNKANDDFTAKIDFNEVELWLEANRTTIPISVCLIITRYNKVIEALSNVKSSAKNLLHLLRREMGFIPKSESGANALNRHKDNPKPAAKNATEKQPDGHSTPSDEPKEITEAKNERNKLNKKIDSYYRKLKNKSKKRKPRQKKTSSSEEAKKQTLVPSANQTEEQPAEQTTSSMTRITESDTCVLGSNEELFSGNVATHEQTQLGVTVDRMAKFGKITGLHVSNDTRTRTEFELVTRTIDVKVETVTDMSAGKSATASTDHIGPPNSQITWLGVANTIIMVAGYAWPINRLANMLQRTCPYFTSSRIVKILEVAAQIFTPIYVCLGEQLANSSITVKHYAYFRTQKSIG